MNLNRFEEFKRLAEIEDERLILASDFKNSIKSLYEQYKNLVL